MKCRMMENGWSLASRTRSISRLHPEGHTRFGLFKEKWEHFLTIEYLLFNSLVAGKMSVLYTKYLYFPVYYSIMVQLGLAQTKLRVIF